jgi:hypothetical protein
VDLAAAEAEHEENVAEMHRAADALREALAAHLGTGGRSEEEPRPLA